MRLKRSIAVGGRTHAHSCDLQIELCDSFRKSALERHDSDSDEEQRFESWRPVIPCRLAKTQTNEGQKGPAIFPSQPIEAWDALGAERSRVFTSGLRFALIAAAAVHTS